MDGHDSPEVEIYGMDGVPQEDVQRHYDGLPPIPYTKGKLIIGDSSILPILAAQKASVAMLLAESKNMTVQGDGVISGVSAGNSIPANSSSSDPFGSSAMSVVSPPLPSINTPITAPSQPYWPYMMPPEYAASYAQYYQAYYASQSVQGGNSHAYYPSTESVPLLPVITTSSVPDEPLVIQPHVDPVSNKTIPGTIFTVPSLDRSLEELRSELKKYNKKQ